MQAISFKREFPNFDPATMPEIPSGFTDSSWHNDICPSFYDEARKLRLFINYLDPEERELPFKRFIVDRFDQWTDTEGVLLLETEDWNEVLNFISQI